MQAIKNYLSLDIGNARTGVATANSIAKIASVLTTLDCSVDDLPAKIEYMVIENEISELVIGLPRGRDGQDTEQTKHIESVIKAIASRVNIPIHVKDEFLTSIKAEQELKSLGRPYDKGDIDALAALYILQDYLDEDLS